MLIRAPAPAGRRQIWADLDVVVWLLLGDRPRVSQAARLALEDERNRVVVSAGTVWARTEGLELVSADARLAAYGVDLVW